MLGEGGGPGGGGVGGRRSYLFPGMKAFSKWERKIIAKIEYRKKIRSVYVGGYSAIVKDLEPYPSIVDNSLEKLRHPWNPSYFSEANCQEQVYQLWGSIPLLSRLIIWLILTLGNVVHIHLDEVWLSNLGARARQSKIGYLLLWFSIRWLKFGNYLLEIRKFWKEYFDPPLIFPRNQNVCRI